jgi:hypothetical protein
VLSLNAYPTLDQHDYPGPANWTVNPDGTQTLSIPQQQLQQVSCDLPETFPVVPGC